MLQIEKGQFQDNKCVSKNVVFLFPIHKEKSYKDLIKRGMTKSQKIVRGESPLPSDAGFEPTRTNPYDVYLSPWAVRVIPINHSGNPI